MAKHLSWPVLLMLCLLMPCVTSFGISYNYLPNDTLSLYPGQNYLFKLTIQNKDPDWIRVNVSLNSSHAVLIGGPVLDIPGESYDYFVYFNITMPQDAEIGQYYNVRYLVTPLERGDGQIALRVRYDRILKVLAVEPTAAKEAAEFEPLKETPWYASRQFMPLTLLVAGIVLLVLLIILWRKSRQVSDKYSVRKVSVVPEPSEPELDPSHYFVLLDGQKLKGLKDLREVLKTMPIRTFKHHVNSQKNDFAQWVSHALNRPQLAEKMMDKEREEMIRLIEDEIKL